ncbi:hypothetical protein LTR91_016713 [Friedmanniomyces endolithicus]|uniref:SET domain-containing protein n=1 Tax=Friedmanniomyces endolithicus TaxID=329885 RepID=A0AAN6K7D6_9PEZI|nr:hypothetical protein LTS09_012587 [Friedmanniomyces endolithicus]KAK0356623.1 hypothetical protein LTR94_003477 [Friedmanniomyces endolithicus]KAK0770354.1 hypothetical protein LTR38_017599 [Friedmanniomyces endolithicus]KAK0773708.1 hypothetical protein LTR75_017054 [Friedmanniomyces endolithicus]KAK0792614.1 hypothetical protein LTR59_008424 [Friedmanniomyces endolithicus]
MISEGKAAGWLQLPTEAFLPWAKLNDIAFDHALPGVSMGKGGALLASNEVNSNGGTPQALMTVPRSLILSLERVMEHAKVDKDFREVLESLGEFGRSLPCELLPTFWSSSELQLLVGSTLAPAISSKLRSLRREYDNLCEATRTTPWFQIVQDALAFDDWLQVDAMYRSRALDFPEIGHCMVPCIDLANHAAGEATTAIYEKDGDGNAVLLLRNGKSLAKGEEVTITYGDEKGACEMLFSYGFLESERQSAETLFLSLSIPDDDPYRGAKMRFADCAPGFKLIDAEDGQVDWKGEFIWLLCVSKEDGLHFDLARRVDGEEEVHAFFGEHELMGGAQELHAILGKTDLWDVYHLRAVTILQQRVFEQMQVLYGTQEDIEATAHGEGTDVRDRCYEQAMQLRRLEMKLLNSAYEDFELQTERFAESEVVLHYLARVNDNDDDTNAEQGEAEVEEDFS